MDGESFEKIIKHIKYYNEAKKNKDFAKFHINKNSGANFCIAQTKDEVLFIFLSSKKTFKFIREYEQYKRNLKIEDEREASKITFEEVVKNIPENKFMNYCQNKKLNNVFRNTKIKNFMHSPLKQDRYCYYDFFYHKLKFYVHTGFVLLYNTIAPELTKEVKRYLNNTNKKIVFIGFSFASILARLAYLVYFLKYPTKLDRIECYLYSTPNIGNKYFEKYYETLHRKEKYRRLFIVNFSNDCVYNMMSKRFGFRYMKSTLLIKKENEKRKIYTSKNYEEELEKFNNF